MLILIDVLIFIDVLILIDRKLMAEELSFLNYLKELCFLYIVWKISQNGLKLSELWQFKVLTTPHETTVLASDIENSNFEGFVRGSKILRGGARKILKYIK